MAVLLEACVHVWPVAILAYTARNLINIIPIFKSNFHVFSVLATISALSALASLTICLLPS